MAGAVIKIDFFKALKIEIVYKNGDNNNLKGCAL